MGRKSLRPTPVWRSAAARGLSCRQDEQPVSEDLPNRVDDVALVGESSSALPIHDDDYVLSVSNNLVVEFRLAEITRDFARLSIDDDSPPQSCAEGAINNPNPIGHIVDSGKHKIYFYNALEPPTKKMKLMDLSDHPTITNCEGNVPAHNSSNNTDENCYSTTLVCRPIASTSFAGENTLMVIDSSSSQDSENVVNEESSSVSFAAPLQTIASTSSSSGGENIANVPTVGTDQQPKPPRAPRGSGRIMLDITNHYKNLSPKNKLAFAERNRAILSKFADESVNSGQNKDSKKKGVGNYKNKKKQKQKEKK